MSPLPSRVTITESSLRDGLQFFGDFIPLPALGGCPDPPRASGNVAPEDEFWLLDGMVIEHSLDSTRVAGVARQFCAEPDLTYNSDAGKAMFASWDVA